MSMLMPDKTTSDALPQTEVFCLLSDTDVMKSSLIYIHMYGQPMFLFSPSEHIV